MNSQLTNLKQSVEHMIDVTINQDKVDAFKNVLDFIRILQESEAFHFNIAYTEGYLDASNQRMMKEDYFTSKYSNNVQPTTDK